MLRRARADGRGQARASRREGRSTRERAGAGAGEGRAFCLGDSAVVLISLTTTMRPSTRRRALICAKEAAAARGEGRACGTHGRQHARAACGAKAGTRMQLAHACCSVPWSCATPGRCTQHQGRSAQYTAHQAASGACPAPRPHLITRPKPPDPISSNSLYSLYSHWCGRATTALAAGSPPLLSPPPPPPVSNSEVELSLMLLQLSPPTPMPPPSGPGARRGGGGACAHASCAAAAIGARLLALAPLPLLAMVMVASLSPHDALTTWSASSCQPAGARRIACGKVRAAAGGERITGHQMLVSDHRRAAGGGAGAKLMARA